MGSPGTVVVPFEGEFAQITKGLDAFVSSGIGKMLHLEQLSKSSFVRVGAAAFAIGFGLFKVGEAFDDAYDKIRVGTGATGKQLERLQGDFKSVVKSVPADFGTASTAISELHERLDLMGGPLQARSKQFLELSRITETDLNGNIEAGAQLLNNWGIAGKAQGSTLDYLFRLTQQTGVGFAGLASDVASGGSIARTAGLDFNQTAAFVALLNKNGIEASPVWMSLGRAIASAAEQGRPANEVLRETFDAIKGAPDLTSAAGVAIDVFGQRAGPKLAALIREGKFSYDDLAASIAGGRETIMGASKDTQDFAEKWQILKNRAMVAFQPIALKVFDIIGKIGGALADLPDGSLQFLVMGGAAAFAIPKLAGVASGIVDIVRNGEGFSGFAQRSGLALGGLSLGLGLVKPKLDEMGVSAEISGAAVGAMTGIAFGPWGAAIGGVLGGIAGHFGLMGDASEDAERRANESMRRLKAEITQTATGIVDAQGRITDDVIRAQLQQVGAFKGVGEALDANGVSWQTFMGIVNGLRIVDTGKGLSTNFSELAANANLSAPAIKAVEGALGPTALKLAKARDEAFTLAKATGDVNAVNEIAFGRWNEASGALDNWLARAGRTVPAEEQMATAASNMARTVKEHYDAVVRQTGSLEAGSMVLEGHRQKLTDLGVAAGLPIEKARALSERLIGLNGFVATPKVDVNTQPAEEAFWRFLTWANNQRIVVNAWANAIGGWGRYSGGPVPGAPSQAVPITAHGGEYVLSADVVDRIKQGAPSRGADVVGGSAAATGSSTGGGGITIENAYFGDRDVIPDLDYFAKTRMAAV